MHPLISLAVGLVVAWAVKRRNGPDDENDLGLWRLAAGAAGALVPYAEGLFWLGGAGMYYQAEHGLLWSLLLLPLLSFVTAEFMGYVSGKGWGRFFWIVLPAMLATLIGGLLTADGIQPFALLLNIRFALGLVYDFDGVILGLCLLTLGMGYAFRFWQRDIARLGLGCIGIYLVALGGLHYVAWSFGGDYAEAMNLPDGYNVDALPQPLSPFNWRVVVLEDPALGTTGSSSHLHDTFINLKGGHAAALKADSLRAQRVQALYRPRNQAEWRVYPRFGGVEMNANDQRRIKLAWYAWSNGPFGWLAKYAAYDDAVKSPLDNAPTAPMTCLRYRDIRFDGARDNERGTYVLCPSASGGARVFVPYTLWPFATGYHELVPVEGVRN